MVTEIKNLTKNFYDNYGFTLVEVLITIFVLGTALTATLYLIMVNIQNANAIRNNITASGLLQEGIEVVRNIRDRDWHLSQGFGASLPNGIYRVQWNTVQCDGAGAPAGCANPPLLPLNSNPPLKYDSATGLFNYDTGSDTLFRRSVQIETPSIVEKKVTVTVSWTVAGRTKSISAETHLYDWR